MSLTHVRMWSGHGWKKVTVSEAAKKFPYGISARSGLFMCDLCGQYVTLTIGGIRDPYFKHSSEEKSKDCPERTFSNGSYPTFDAQVHELPIKIQIKSSEQFEFEMGFISPPPDLIGERDDRKIIIYGNNNSSGFQYSLERLSSNGITYLPVGNTPCKTYKISHPFDAQKIKMFWPTEVHGVTAEGTLFDSKTGKKLPEDADVSVGHTYYLITKRHYINNAKYISGKSICTSSKDYFNTWYVYEIQATKYDESSARFFLDLHARLTDHPVNFYPIWPEFIEDPYKVMHRDDELYFYLEGEGVTSKAFPNAYIQETNLPVENSQILHIICNERQQLVSAGRVKVLKYTYLWKDELNRTISSLETRVYSIDGRQIMPGIYQDPPVKEQITITCEADGFIEIDDLDGFPVSKYYFSAGQKLVVEKIQLGTIVNIYYGLDCVWTARYEKAAINDEIDDRDLIKKLESYHDDYIRLPHAAGSFAVKLQSRPLLHDWFCIQVKKGKISRSALNILKLEGELA